MSVLVRAASLADRRAMAELIGITAAALGEKMDDFSAFSAWHLAEDGRGTIVGVQHIGPGEAQPVRSCEIATFVDLDQDNIGIGSRLFAATEPVARLLGYRFVDAMLDPGNEAARIYYQSRGFREAGQAGGKRRMRYDLD